MKGMLVLSLPHGRQTLAPALISAKVRCALVDGTEVCLQDAFARRDRRVRPCRRRLARTPSFFVAPVPTARPASTGVLRASLGRPPSRRSRTARRRAASSRRLVAAEQAEASGCKHGCNSVRARRSNSVPAPAMQCARKLMESELFTRMRLVSVRIINPDQIMHVRSSPSASGPLLERPPGCRQVHRSPLVRSRWPSSPCGGHLHRRPGGWSSLS